MYNTNVINWDGILAVYIFIYLIQVVIALAILILQNENEYILKTKGDFLIAMSPLLIPYIIFVKFKNLGKNK